MSISLISIFVSALTIWLVLLSIGAVLMLDHEKKRVKFLRDLRQRLDALEKRIGKPKS